MVLNPSLPLLIAVSLAGLLPWRQGGRWRPLLPGGAGVAWAVFGLSSLFFLAPTLEIVDGVPSPAADLARHPPWQQEQQTGDPTGGNPVLVDVTYQIQPWLLFLRREWRAGRVPWWNPHQSSGAPFWSNGQAAPLFPLHLLFVCLPLQLGLVVLPWLRLVSSGLGAWFLSRELGLSRSAALTAGVSFSLCGMLSSFVLYPMGNALALVPWILWAVERLASGHSGWRPLACLGGLQCLAGHPETVVHTALLTALYLLVRGGEDKRRIAVGFLAGWGTAAVLGAVQTLPLAFLLTESSRWLDWLPGERPPLSLVLKLPLRLVLPNLYGHPAVGTWWGPFYYSSTAVYLGAPILPLAAVGLSKLRSDRRFRAVAAVLALSFLGAYHLPVAHEMLQMLPLVSRALHHRLLFGVCLGLSLLAACGVDQLCRGRGRGLLAGCGVVLLMLGAAWWIFAGEWQSRALLVEQAGWSGWHLAVLLFLALLLPGKRLSSIATPVARYLPVLLVCDLAVAHGGINPGLSLSRLFPSTPALQLLQASEKTDFRVAGVAQTLRPNAAMVFGLYDIRGDDPLKIARYERVYGSLATPHPFYFRPVREWDSPWLDRLGVRWVVAGPQEAPASPLWRELYAGHEARIYERPSALPLVRWEKAEIEGQVEVRQREPGSWRLLWSTPTRGLLVVAETWDRGWKASTNGRSVPVHLTSETLVGVELGPGSGELRLVYRPRGIGWGIFLTASGLVLLMIRRIPVGVRFKPGLGRAPTAP